MKLSLAYMSWKGQVQSDGSFEFNSRVFAHEDCVHQQLGNISSEDETRTITAHLDVISKGFDECYPECICPFCDKEIGEAKGGIELIFFAH